MMEETPLDTLLRSLPMLFSIVMHAAMLIVPVYCIVKRPTPPAYVMLAGVLVEIPGTLFSVWWSVWGMNFNMPITEISQYFGIMGTISHIGSLLFACGFLLFIHDALRKRVSL
jgi:hypothetical protein